MNQNQSVSVPARSVVDFSHLSGDAYRRAMMMENCGWIAVVNHPDAGPLATRLLTEVADRGQSGAGLSNGEKAIRRLGDPTKVFGYPGHQEKALDELCRETLRELPGTTIIGHTRLPTHGCGACENLQPLSLQMKAEDKDVRVELAINGTFANADKMRAEFEFPAQPDTDSIVLLYAMRMLPDDLTIREKLIHALNAMMNQEKYGVEFGGFSGVLRASDQVFLFRDPYGPRPAAFGLISILGESRPAVVAASETGALRAVGTSIEWEVLPGELLEITSSGNILSESPFRVKGARAFCIFEVGYFSRADSRLPETNMRESYWEVRKRLGRTMAEKLVREGMDPPDIIGYFPKSAEPQWQGMLEIYGDKGVHFYLRKLAGRSFLGATEEEQKRLAQNKLIYIPGQVSGKNVWVVDDTLMRGTTTSLRTVELRSDGAKSITLVIPFALTPRGCPKGVNFPDSSKLLANRFGGDLNKIAKEIGVDRVITFTPEETLRAIHPSLDLDTSPFCMQCMTDLHPSVRRNPLPYPGFKARSGSPVTIRKLI